MKAIVAVNKKWAIGLNGNLLYSLRGDMKFFRETTMGKTVLMGRKTLDSFPNGKPLKNRTNIVISRHKDEREDVVWVSSIKEAISQITDTENTYLIGGASIYEQMIDYCSEAYVTVIDDDKMGDSFFPNLDSREGWELYETSEQFEENGITYRFCKYKKQ